MYVEVEYNDSLPEPGEEVRGAGSSRRGAGTHHTWGLPQALTERSWQSLEEPGWQAQGGVGSL